MTLDGPFVGVQAHEEGARLCERAKQVVGRGRSDEGLDLGSRGEITQIAEDGHESFTLERKRIHINRTWRGEGHGCRSVATDSWRVGYPLVSYTVGEEGGDDSQETLHKAVVPCDVARDRRDGKEL